MSTQDAAVARGGRPWWTIAIAGAAVAWILVLTAAASAPAAGWRPPVDISAPQSPSPMVNCGFLISCNFPGAAGVDVAVNSRGDTVAAWTRRDGGAQTVQVAIRPAGGSFGPAQTLGTTFRYIFGRFGPLADAAIDDQGNAIVVWPQAIAGRTVVRAATRAPGGAFGGSFSLSDEAQSADADPRVAMSRGGHTMVVWSLGSATPDAVQFTARPPGGSFSSPTGLSAVADADTARVAINNTGRAVVVWRSGDPALIQARVRSSAGGAFAAAQDLSTAGEEGAAPDVAIDGQGRATAIWARNDDGGDDLIQSRPLTAAGLPASAIDTISDAGRDGSSPQVALDTGNAAVAAWTDCTTAGANCVVATAGRPSGASFGPVQPVSAPGDSNSAPKVALDSVGTALIAWSQFGAATRIQTIRRSPNGAFSGVTPISAAAGAALMPALAVDGAGSTIAGWAFSRPAPDGRQVAQFGVYDAGAPVFTNLAVPGTATRGRAIGMLAAAGDRYSGASISWIFGDGATATGTSVSHAYAARGVFTVMITARDAAGNASSTTRTVQVANPGRIRSTVSTSWSVLGSRTTIVKLLVRGVPKGARVRARCLGPRCSFKRKTAKRRRNATANVRKALGRKRVLRAGQTLEVRITKRGVIGKAVRYKMRTGKLPRSTTLCIPAGKSKPQRRC